MTEINTPLRPTVRNFEFLWDSWEDRVIIPELEEVPGRKAPEPAPSDWISINDVAQARGLQLEIFLPLYRQAYNHPVIRAHDNQPPSPLLSADLEIAGTSLSNQSSSTYASIPDSLECSICGEQVTVKFRNCTHAVCAPCAGGLWRTKVQHARHFPSWFSCPLCRTEIHEVGMLSQQPQNCGFGEEVRFGDIDLTVWSWQPVRRWAALNEANVARRLKSARMNRGRYYLLLWRVGHGYQVVPIKGWVEGGLRAVKVEDRVLGWPALILLFFASVALGAVH